MVTLNGSGVDMENQTLSYLWEQTGGTPMVTLINTSDVRPTFTAAGSVADGCGVDLQPDGQ